MNGSASRIYASTNGLKWSSMFPSMQESMTPTNVNATTFTGKEFVVLGPYQVFYSAGGTEWLFSFIQFPGKPVALAAGNDSLVAVTEQGKAILSTNRFVSWNTSDLGAPLQTISFGKGYFLAGREIHSLPFYQRPSLAPITLPEQATWTASTFGHGKFLLGGSNGSVYFSDAFEATQTNHPPKILTDKPVHDL